MSSAAADYLHAFRAQLKNTPHKKSDVKYHIITENLRGRKLSRISWIWDHA